MALLDSDSTHTIMRDPWYFKFSRHDSETPSWRTYELNTVAGKRKMTFREGRAGVKLPGGATFICSNAMFAPEAERSLISLRNLRAHGIHALTTIMDGEEILKLMQGGMCLATACYGASGLYEILISSLTAGHQNHSTYSVTIHEKAKLWHWRMGHPGATMFRRMILVLRGDEVCLSDVSKLGVCKACAKGKLILNPSHWKLPKELPPPLHRLQGDICGPIAPESRPFMYFLVLVDAGGVYFEVSLLSTRNIAFSKILASLIKFRAHYLEYLVKFLHIDNTQEFKSYAFEDYCQATIISLTYGVPYEHAQNGLAEAFIKKIQLISRPLLIHAHLPSSFWSHVILHATALLRYRPTMLHEHSPLETLTSHPHSVADFRVFGCRVWVPVPEPKRKTIGIHRQEGIYVGFDFPSIIRWVSPKSGVLHKVRFQNCQFEEKIFPSLTSPGPSQPLVFAAPQTITMNPDPKITIADSKV
jgi:hypothetical protein